MLADSPNEYYISSEGRIFYWPAVPLAEWSEAPVVSVSDVAVRLDGVSHVTLEGLIIAHAKTVGVSAICVSYGPLHNRSVAHPFLLAAFHSKFIGEQ